MQLNKNRKRRSRGQVRLKIAALAAGLLASGGAHAQEQTGPSPQNFPDTSATQKYSNLFYESSEESSPSTGSHLEIGTLYYQEGEGRVRAIEPSLSASLNFGGDQILTFGVISDTLTGASPNGAVPSDKSQNFVTPIKASGSSVTSTSASGGSTIIRLPPTPGQIAAAALGRQYTIAPNTLPADAGFHDQRFAGNIGWSQPIARLTKLSFGAGYSSETDYRAITANTSISQDFNSRNTTVSLSASGEFDTSQPYGGTPTPLTSMNAQWKGPDESRTVIDAVAGLTQVMNRYWLVQANYSFGISRGYNTDPYRILSVVNSVTGEPVDYLYESRPRSRTRQSIYLENKIDVYDNILDLSGRYFWDSWGIAAETVQASDRIGLKEILYVEPQVRWYHQTAASFYTYYLVSGSALPAYASSDPRLGNFTAMTYGMKLGLKVGEESEISLLGQYYKQAGNGHPAGAPGQLANQNLFPAVSAVSLLAGLSIGF